MERLIALYTVTSSFGAVVALVLANLVPLVGVLFLGWSVWTILVIYWLENGIVGVFNVLKMLKAEGTDTSGADGWRVNGRRASTMANATLVPFFMIHYGIFWLVHGVFVLTIAFAVILVVVASLMPTRVIPPEVDVAVGAEVEPSAAS